MSDIFRSVHVISQSVFRFNGDTIGASHVLYDTHKTMTVTSVVGNPDETSPMRVFKTRKQLVIKATQKLGVTFSFCRVRDHSIDGE